MKRLFIILSLVGFSLFSSSYAADGKTTSPVVMQSFQNSFEGAKDVSWEQIGVLYKATFAQEGQYRSAFYNGDGDLVAITRNISSQQLPKALRSSLKKEGFWITDLFVVTIEGDTTYYAKIENADTAVMLKTTGSKKWATYQTSDK